MAIYWWREGTVNPQGHWRHWIPHLLNFWALIAAFSQTSGFGLLKIIFPNASGHSLIYFHRVEPVLLRCWSQVVAVPQRAGALDDASSTATMLLVHQSSIPKESFLASECWRSGTTAVSTQPRPAFVLHCFSPHQCVIFLQMHLTKRRLCSSFYSTKSSDSMESVHPQGQTHSEEFCSSPSVGAEAPVNMSPSPLGISAVEGACL